MIFGTDGKILKINPNKTQLDNNLDPKYQSEMSEYATLNKSKNERIMNSNLPGHLVEVKSFRKRN